MACSLWARPLREKTELPVIDPAEASLEVAEAIAHLGLKHSRTTYPQVPAISQTLTLFYP